jgi:hypothetical protein
MDKGQQTVKKDTLVALRFYQAEKQALQARAAEEGLTLSAYIKRAIQETELQELPEFVTFMVNESCKALGIDFRTLISLCVTATFVRHESEVEAFGRAAFNPFIVSEVDDYQALYYHWKNLYLKELYSDSLGARVHENYVQSQKLTIDRTLARIRKQAKKKSKK